MSNIVSVKKVERAQTYDLEINHPDHQFYLANGILTSNSHAISYAMDSFYCAWLLTHYEAEWLCSYMESMSGNTESRSKAISEIKSFGYEVGSVDINESESDWVISTTRKAFVPSFLTLKHVGNAAIEEIKSFRPYTNIKDLFYDERGIWKNSKFNQRALSNLIKMKAFGSMGIVGPDKFFSSYKHFYHVVIENQGLVHRSLKKTPDLGWKNFNEIATQTHGMEEWTRKEFAMFQKEIVGTINPSDLISDEMKEKFEENDIKSVDHWSSLDLYWFMIENSHKKKTKKGKPYLLLDVIGESGISKRCFMWDWDSRTEFEPYTVCVAEVDNSDFGLSTKMRQLKRLD